MQRAILTCDEGKKAGDDLKKRFLARNTDLETRQTELVNLQKQYEATPVTDAAKRADIAAQVERKGKSLERDKDDFTNDVQQAENELISTIGQKILKVLDEHAKKQGYDLILETSQHATVLWFPKSMDITDEVVAVVNRAGGAPKAAEAKDKPGSTVARVPQN